MCLHWLKFGNASANTLTFFDEFYQSFESKIESKEKMLFFLYTIIFALFLNEYNAAPGVKKLFRSVEKSGLSKGKSTENLNVDDLKFANFPITFACVTDEELIGFHKVVVNDSVIPSTLLERLDNGRGLSLFFHGAINHVTTKYGLMYHFAKEWFTESGSNICIVSYNFDMEPVSGCNPALVAQHDEAIKRLGYVAKLGRDLITGIQDTCWDSEDGGKCLNIHEVDIIGFNFGAHVAAQTCEFLKQKMNQKVRMLLALDPSRTAPIMIEPKVAIKKGIAHYVQVIHTTVEGRNGEVFEKSGDVDIYLKYKPGQPLTDGLDFYVHMATATKRLYMLASEKGSGTIIKRRGRQPFPEPKSNECVVGVYSALNPKKTGKRYVISVANRIGMLKTELGSYAESTILFE
ncbi:uncharacterized protein LOC116348365 [Contarinia nasturtii]|uniref:uncharacterized protein LOC116348365 n=1 Tax=Contarinia nasturtii TaxID=265458 RepID=UPI0012D45471|nr:uncharacterized protein LOC116348365 [Contarinia nasturtii]